MTKRKLVQCLAEVTPSVPDSFHRAMTDTLADIVASERAASAHTTPPSRPQRTARRTIQPRLLIAVIIATLLLSTAAIAAVLGVDLFSHFWGENASMQQDAPDLIQRNVAETTFGNMRVRLEEAAYDGVTLYIKYSVRDMTATEPMTEDDYWSVEAYQVWWNDGFWINGREINMPNLSGGDLEIGEEPGEMIVYEQYRLDQEDVTLQGETRISLPLGEPQDKRSLVRNDDLSYAEPDKGVMTFYVDADTLPGVSYIEPNHRTVCDDGAEVWVSDATFTPLKLYVTLRYAIPQSLLDDYCERAGADGVYSEDHVLLARYTAFDVAEEWANCYTLIDADGRPVSDPDTLYEEWWGGGSPDNDLSGMAFYVFPYLEEYPSPLYIAPYTPATQEADLARKVLIRP